MSKYDVTIRRLAVLLLPIAWRKPLIEAFLFALTKGIETLNSNFSSWRDEKRYRLSATGQVFSLRSVLNDTFDSKSRRIKISDASADAPSSLLLHMRENGAPLMVEDRGSEESLILSARLRDRGKITTDFTVEIPSVLINKIDTTRLSALVNTYKLVGARWSISWI